MEEVAVGSSKKMIATQEEMVEARVPIPYRDQCAHLLIPLNKCRQAELYLPWKCENERHSYEKCEYELVMERMLQMQKIRQKQESRAMSKQQGIPLIPNTANAWKLLIPLRLIAKVCSLCLDSLFSDLILSFCLWGYLICINFCLLVFRRFLLVVCLLVLCLVIS